MLTYPESVQRFEELKNQLRIPADADLALVEKRHIEQLPQGEIEAMEGAPAELQEPAGLQAPENPQGLSGPQGDGDAAGSGNGSAGISERLVWVGEYSLGFMFWELAIDAQGSLVRLRKSR